MGNPHAVTFVEDVRGLDLEKIGTPGFEHHAAFPDRVNTEFVRVIDRHTAEMRVWERGSGETLGLRNRGLCGSGGLHFKWLYRRQSDGETPGRRSGHLLGSGSKPCLYDGAGSDCF